MKLAPDPLPRVETVNNRGSAYNGYPNSPSDFGSYTLDALAISLHCIYHTDSFAEAVEKEVNYLGDADTVATITGQMAGAFYGYTQIDDSLLAPLRNWTLSETRAVMLYMYDYS